MGIAYAAPDMQGGNFWGVINHDNEEGIIRIADNKVTPGLKMWTWGFSSFTQETDERKDPNPGRPYVELWAGVSDQFFHSAKFPARGEVAIPETYSPTVGMRNVTHANEKILVNLAATASGVELEFVSLEPATPLRVTLKRGDAITVRRRRDGRSEKWQSHFHGAFDRRQRRQVSTDDRNRARQRADISRDKQ